jgi:hypothetical protein
MQYLVFWVQTEQMSSPGRVQGTGAGFGELGSGKKERGQLLPGILTNSENPLVFDLYRTQ